MRVYFECGPARTYAVRRIIRHGQAQAAEPGLGPADDVSGSHPGPGCHRP